jgi:hypothetical protein
MLTEIDYSEMDDGAPLCEVLDSCGVSCEVTLTEIDNCEMDDGAPLCEALDSGIDPCDVSCEVTLTEIDYGEMDDGAPLCETLDSGVDPCGVMLTEIDLNYTVVGPLVVLKSMLCGQGVHPALCMVTEITDKDEELLCVAGSSEIDLDTSTILLP